MGFRMHGCLLSLNQVGNEMNKGFCVHLQDQQQLWLGIHMNACWLHMLPFSTHYVRFFSILANTSMKISTAHDSYAGISMKKLTKKLESNSSIRTIRAPFTDILFNIDFGNLCSQEQ